MAHSVKNPNLTERQQRFVEEYCACLNATEAARRAGYSEKTAESQASRLLTKVKISEAIQKRLNEKSMPLDEALERLSTMGRFDLLQFVDEHGRIDFVALKESGASQILKKVKKKVQRVKDAEYETYEYDFKDPESALVHILKAHGAFTERHEHNITGDITINVKPLSGGD